MLIGLEKWDLGTAVSRPSIPVSASGDFFGTLKVDIIPLQADHRPIGCGGAHWWCPVTDCRQIHKKE
jgi:hypothetical protein